MAIVAINASKGDVDALAEMRKYIQTDEEYSAFAKVLYSHFKLP